MKKLSQFLVMTAMVMFSMTACVEEETSAVDVSGTATIKGRVSLDNDETNPGNEKANGAIVRVRYDAGDLSVVQDGDSRWVNLDTTTDADGNYTFEVPATPTGLNFYVEVDEFETSYTYDDGGTDVTVDAIFNKSATTIFNLSTGETKYQDFTLTSKYIYFN